MSDQTLIFIGVIGGIALAFCIFFFSNRKSRIERLEKDVEELKKKDTITENSIASIQQLNDSNKTEMVQLRNSVDKLDTFMHTALKEQEKHLRSALNEVVQSALNPILVEIKHMNKAIDDLKK